MKLTKNSLEILAAMASREVEATISSLSACNEMLAHVAFLHHYRSAMESLCSAMRLLEVGQEQDAIVCMNYACDKLSRATEETNDEERQSLLLHGA